jgi:hypothetical protein
MRRRIRRSPIKRHPVSEHANQIMYRRGATSFVAGPSNASGSARAELLVLPYSLATWIASRALQALGINSEDYPMTNKLGTESFDAGTREAVNDLFDVSKWRDEVASSTERYSETILEKMVAAATAMGWPKEVVDASRAYLVQASKMQTRMIDQLMDAWQAQLKLPMPGQFVAQLQPYSVTGSGPRPGIEPVQLWMEAAQMWQRNWASAFSMWTDAGNRAQRSTGTSIRR